MKKAGIPRGWSVMEQTGKVKLRVRFGTDGQKAQWTKTLPIQWEVGCIGELIKTLKALVAATSGDKPKLSSEA